MDTRLLQDVLVLLEEGSLSAAAERRNLTQPAFSRRIRAFEDWVGIPLLNRTANRIDVHPRLATRSEEIRATIDRIESLRAVLRSGSPNERDLVFSVQHALAMTVFPKVLESFHLTDQTITARLRTSNREECISLFVRGEADYLLVYEARGLPPLPFDESIGRHIWMRDTLIPLCGGHLRYKLGPDNRPNDRFPLITYPAESHFGRLLHRDGLETALLADGAHVSVETAFTVGVRKLVQYGQGVGWLPHSMCQKDLASGAMIDLSDAYGQVPLDVSIFYLAGDEEAQKMVARLSSDSHAFAPQVQA
jgi:DNA-binding transcriptional LysR family regulator